MKFGAIDIGTNAARLLIGEVVNDEKSTWVKKISYTRIPLRLGVEVFSKGSISSKKAEEFKKSMLAFKLIADVFNVKELRACATSAMREADNGKEIREMILAETGIPIEIIDGEVEAEIIFTSFLKIDYDLSKPFIVIDVGGGSTEISIFYRGEKNNSRSFKIGTLRMLKKKVDKDIWDTINEWLQKTLRKDMDYLVFATGGNINKTHKLLGKKGNEPISYKDLKEIYGELKSLSLAKRISKFQLRPDRADVIVPAMQIFLKILKRLDSSEMYVPKVGLSDGMIQQMHQKHLAKKDK
ncbi:Ppx/GppA phosphatase family protein [Crocinitomix algicola]|uniref:Ppx/GppA phosphatase family protein n=1 Tax=Crocinitomix algicola TaxID=1740263 RepID=UPI000872E963|nr:hypothetical protein [Crocinitomix algicola]